MNKKRVSLLFSLLVLLSLGVFYVFADITGTIPKTTDVFSLAGNVSEVPETINLTMTVGSQATDNITNVTFILGGTDSGVYSWDFVDHTGAIVETTPDAGSSSNYTYSSAGFADWNCTNISLIEIECLNNSLSTLDGVSNTTLGVTINVTSAANESLNTITIRATDSTNLMNSTTVSLLTDNLVPRLMALNVSDGSTTVNNGSLAGTTVLNTRNALTVEATIADYNLESAILFGYSCQSGTNIAWTGTGANVSVVATSGRDLIRGVATATIPAACFATGTQDFVNFSFLVNDSFNHETTLNESGALAFTLEGDYNITRVVRVNLTHTKLLEDGTTKTNDLDSSSNGLDGSGDYISNDNLTFYIELAGNEKPVDVYLVWNETGAATTELTPIFGAGWTRTNLHPLNMELNATNVSATAGIGSALYTTSQTLVANESDYAFYVYANNSVGNYTAVGGVYRFTVDNTAPTLVMAAPDDRTITPRGSITYSCTGSDSTSGVYRIMWELQKPDNSDWIKIQDYEDVSSNADSVTFSAGDTNLAGTYSVKCTAVDNAGNEGSHTSGSSETFSVHFSTSSGGDGSGGSGGGSAASIDLSAEEESNMVEMQGVITTFTLDGTTVHKITIKEVTLTTVTIVIESDPIELTLAIGETKEVDVDGDGENDISVTLNDITDAGAADLTTKRLTPLPEETTPTETTPTETTPTETTPTMPEEEPSNAWLWVLIVVILAVVGAGYFFIKKK